MPFTRTVEAVTFEIDDCFSDDTLKVCIGVHAIDGNKYITTEFYMTRGQFEKFKLDGDEFFATDEGESSEQG